MKKTRMIIDIAMTLILPLLMAYSLIGELFHEVIGIIMMILFVLHHILNLNWYKNLFKGKYTLNRAIRTFIVLVLSILMILQPLSGILISKHLFTFIQMDGSALFRQIHLLCGYWSFVLMNLHVGTHLNIPLTKLKYRNDRSYKAVMALLTIISFYGNYAFFKRGFTEYLFLKTFFVFYDLSEPLLFFLSDYIAVMILFMDLGRIIVGRSRSEKC